MPSRAPGTAALKRRRLLALVTAAAALVPLRPARPFAAAGEPDQGARFVCLHAGCWPYIYDPTVGDPYRGTDAGTAFADLPDDWRCPVCGAGKDEFAPMA